MTAVVARGLGRRYGAVVALDDVSITVEPGTVVALLGPNGAGKSTAISRMLDLVPGEGETLFEGARLVDLPRPSATVGALVDGNPLIRSWTSSQHLDSLARLVGASRSRGAELLETVGLAEVADRPVRALSLGSRQRLGLALALLDRPSVLVLDEPSGGLDPLGVEWLFGFLRGFADDGGAVLISSHQLGELALAADSVVLLVRGALVWSGRTQDFLTRTAPASVRVQSPDPEALAGAVRTFGGTVARQSGQTAWIEGMTAAEVGRMAAVQRIELHELVTELQDMQAAFTSALRQESGA